MSERNTALDIARGLGIIIVCVFHIVYVPEDSFANTLIRDGIWFIIPFFFLISGYVCSPYFWYSQEDKNFLSRTSYRIKRLLIPTLKYTLILLISWGIYCMIFHGVTIQELLRDFILTFLRPEFYKLLINPDVDISGLVYDLISTSWFVWTMIFAAPLYYLLVDFTDKGITRLFLVCALLIILSIILYPYSSFVSWSLTLVPVYTSISLCGSFIARYELIEKLCKGKFSYLAAIICAVIQVWLFTRYGHSWVYSNVVGTPEAGIFAPLIFFVQVFIGGYAFIVLSLLLEKLGFIGKIFAFIGENSMPVMFTHRVFAAIFSDLIGYHIKSWEFWFVPFTFEAFAKSFAGLIFALTAGLLIAEFLNARSVKHEA